MKCWIDMSLCRNKASGAEIKEHLLGCDFSPSLDVYVKDLDEYINKIISNAERFEVWEGKKLIGFLACYANNYGAKEAFITMISVLPEARGKGLATSLLKDAADYCANKGFNKVSLEVRDENTNALSLYEREGYKVISRNDGVLRLERRI